MKIQLTEKLDVNETDIARLVHSPFERAVSSLQAKARQKAATKWIKQHRWILTLQTLPDDIYNALPKTDSLTCINANRGVTNINCGKVPDLSGLTGDHFGGPKVTTKLVDIIACHPEAAKEYEATKAVEERGKQFEQDVRDYLNASGFTSPTQIAWSAMPLVDLMLTINPVDTVIYGRRHHHMGIFLARLNKRRYIQRTDMRRPKVVHMLPDALLPAIGEAKLLHAAQKK
ncbi:MAG: hypothetical protein GY906_24630 [bacterium]|nr:hypothetical protein [bacterium]